MNTASDVSEGEADVGSSNIWEKSIEGKGSASPNGSRQWLSNDPLPCPTSLRDSVRTEPVACSFLASTAPSTRLWYVFL